jgi:hypothetical protein
MAIYSCAMTKRRMLSDASSFLSGQERSKEGHLAPDCPAGSLVCVERWARLRCFIPFFRLPQQPANRGKSESRVGELYSYKVTDK